MCSLLDIALLLFRCCLYLSLSHSLSVGCACCVLCHVCVVCYVYVVCVVCVFCVYVFDAVDWIAARKVGKEECTQEITSLTKLEVKLELKHMTICWETCGLMKIRRTKNEKIANLILKHEGFFFYIFETILQKLVIFVCWRSNTTPDIKLSSAFKVDHTRESFLPRWEYWSELNNSWWISGEMFAFG